MATPLEVHCGRRTQARSSRGIVEAEEHVQKVGEIPRCCQKDVKHFFRPQHFLKNFFFLFSVYAVQSFRGQGETGRKKKDFIFISAFIQKKKKKRGTVCQCTGSS